MTTYLDDILVHHRQRSADDTRPLEPLLDRARRAPTPRRFTPALRARGLAVIAEVKRRSPSRGDLDPDLDPAAVARDYERGGAACLSVLTDGPHFGGSTADLRAARSAVSLPTLRKDFTVGVRDVLDARLMGADAVLLIAAALDDHTLRDLYGLASELSLAALVEVHDLAEAERAVTAGADIIGVNQRDLSTFEVRFDLAASLAADLPRGAVLVAESGIRGPEDARRVADAGFDAVLVGESLVTADDPAAALARLVAN